MSNAGPSGTVHPEAVQSNPGQSRSAESGSTYISNEGQLDRQVQYLFRENIFLDVGNASTLKSAKVRWN